MNFDFTTNKFYQLCKVVKINYTAITFEEYLSLDELPQKFVIMRHDVDRKPQNSFIMAKIEHELGIKATYYFRMDDNIFRPDIIQEIRDMRHEVGYHYEVLGKSKGNYKKAIELFEFELREFRKIYNVKTICMHGNPLSKYDNRDLWKYYDFKNFDIIGDAYLSIKDINYFSDTGRWNSRNNMRDFIPEIKNNEKITVNSTDDLIDLIKSNKFNNLYILIHPERWASTNIEWGFNYMKDFIFNLGKKVLIVVRRHENTF